MSDLPLDSYEQHRIYMVRNFSMQDGDIFCSGFPRANPSRIIAARFPSATIVSAWQENVDFAKLNWPLELVTFHADTLPNKRFRFTLTCVDFEWIWESEWPQLIQN
jgi:hypothetical protein